MSAIKISGNLFFDYICVNADITDDVVSGVSSIGAVIYNLDTGGYLITKSDMTTVDFYLPVSTPA